MAGHGCSFLQAVLEAQLLASYKQLKAAAGTSYLLVGCDDHRCWLAIE
jgi:hypothetical protein